MVQWIQTNAIQLLGILVPLIIGVGGWFFKKNSGASVGCSLYLTKKLGVGILTTAQKKAILKGCKYK